MPPTTAEEQARQAERDRQAQSQAVAGAQAVADAVKKVADDAVAGAKAARASGPEGDFVVTGVPGGRFTIRGKGFTASGSVLMGGNALKTLEWGNEYIRGELPANAKSGEVVVQIDEKTQQRGYLKVA
jgi:hypothetical protein